MPPSYLVQNLFLGKSCGQGVNPTLWAKLSAVQDTLQSIFDGLPDDQKINPITGAVTTSFVEWCGLEEPTIGWRPKAGYHSSGSAVDINVTTNPYIVTRTVTDTQTILGGEAAGASLTDMRQQAAAVYDRAVQFTGDANAVANVGIRAGSGDSLEATSEVYDRFFQASNALVSYLTFAFKVNGPKRINRAPIPNVEQAADEDLPAQIPDTERLVQDEAISQIATYMASDDFQNTHPNWPNNAQTQYFRILRDYELVRVPMVFGNPSASPASTRNPARGFLDLRKELVVAMCDGGDASGIQLRWGACDFGLSQSGDIQHFDLGNHGGFTPENE